MHSFQIIIFPRRHSLALIWLDPLSTVARAKRARSSERKAASETTGMTSAQAEVDKRLDDLGVLAEGQMVHVMTGNIQDYSLFRMKLSAKQGRPRSSRQGTRPIPSRQLSSRPSGTVKATTPYNAEIFGRESTGSTVSCNLYTSPAVWRTANEIDTQSQNVIIELFDADTRIEALIF